MASVTLEDQALVFVVRKDGDPGLYLAPGVTKGHAVLLLELLAQRLREEISNDASS